MQHAKKQSLKVKVNVGFVHFSLLWKGYKDHIRTQRPEEDIRDLSTFDQKKYNCLNFLPRSRKGKKEPESLTQAACQTNTMMV